MTVRSLRCEITNWRYDRSLNQIKLIIWSFIFLMDGIMRILHYYKVFTSNMSGELVPEDFMAVYQGAIYQGFPASRTFLLS